MNAGSMSLSGHQLPFATGSFQADAVYLFKGDEFGVKLSTGSSGSTVVEYQANLDKSDVTFKLSQMADETGRAMMVLVIRNRTRRELDMKALMTVPGEKGVFPTTIASVQAGLTGYESWPHPIVQLCLSSFRLR